MTRGSRGGAVAAPCHESPRAETPILEVRALHKSYGTVEAVRGVSFRVARGTCFGLLGPNGAGKSTTIEMVQTLLEPDQGEILYSGAPAGPGVVERIGIQFQETCLPALLSVRETLDTFRALYAKPRPTQELIDLCQLSTFQHQRHETISGGQRQRLLVALSLCNDPELLLLDEPTTGLDPQARRQLWQTIATIKAEGKTILLSTHYMEEAYELCDEIAIMDAGRVVAQGEPRRLLQEHFHATVLELPGAPAIDAPAVKVRRHGGSVEIHTEDLNGTLKELVERGVDLGGLRLRKSTLEDLFLEITGKELRA